MIIYELFLNDVTSLQFTYISGISINKLLLILLKEVDDLDVLFSVKICQSLKLINILLTKSELAIYISLDGEIGRAHV